MIEREYYFDNSATTKISPKALTAVNDAYENFGNPSSLHKKGADAAKRIRSASISVAKLLNSDGKGSIVFTSGGTEANNIAILGGFYSKKRKCDDTVMITDSEHASVEIPAQKLEKEGYKIIRVPTKGGKLDIDFVRENLTPSLVLASFMSVNNETGAVYNVSEAFSIIKRFDPNIITHTDAVQAFGKIKLDSGRMNADMISVSSHKICGPMGAGALYISKETVRAKRISPIFFGGGQQNDLRSGTENLPAILGFAAACDEAYLSFKSNTDTMQDVRAYLVERLSELNVKINSPVSFAPHIVNITLPGIKSEVMLHFLSAKNIYISGGSACSSNHPAISRALKAFGLSDFDADCSVRISLSYLNTKDEVDFLIDNLSDGISSLIKRKR